MAFRRRWLMTSIVFAMASVMIGLFSLQPHVASAAATPPQCDGVMNGGGTGIACTVTVDNYVNASGTATAPSTVTVTVCQGAAGIIPGGGGCAAPVTTTLAGPITVINQCNGSGSGGGGVVICTATVTNHFTAAPAAILPATLYQCVGSDTTGTAVLACTPANTGALNVTDVTVGQCTGSGNGGGTREFTCSMDPASTMTSTLPINIQQCNSSGNGGGSLVRCTARVSNLVIAAPATPTVAATTTVTSTATVAPTATTAATATPTVAVTATPTVAPTSTATPTVVPTSTATPTVAPFVAPLPPATGNGSPGTTSHTVLWMLGAAAMVAAGSLLLTGRRLVSQRHNR